MCGIPVLLGAFDVSKREAVEPRQTRDLGTGGRNGDENNPSNDPNWKEYDGHHAKEADEEVGI